MNNERNRIFGFQFATWLADPARRRFDWGRTFFEEKKKILYSMKLTKRLLKVAKSKKYLIGIA